jgi:hypothetical protein
MLVRRLPIAAAMLALTAGGLTAADQKPPGVGTVAAATAVLGAGHILIEH